MRALPDPRVLGPLFGKDVQSIIRAAKQGDFRLEDDQVVVFDGDQEWTVNRSDIEIGYVGKDGQDVVSDRGILVSLNCEITPDLFEDYVMRELNRVVQD